MEDRLVKVFKALGEPTRLKIIKMLFLQSMCVCELSEVLDMLQPRISQHLKILKEAGLIREKKEGYWVCYSLDKEKLQGIWDQFLLFLEADLKDLEGFEEQYNRLSSLNSNEKIAKIKENLKKQT